MELVERVQQVLFRPTETWPIIAGESTTPLELYKQYLLPLAAIGPLCMVVGWCVIGMSIPFSGTMRLSLWNSVAYAGLAYVMSLVAVFLYALVINTLAPAFGGVTNFTQALKVAGYAMTATFVGGVAYLMPILGMFVFLAMLYGLYLLYLGLPVLMKSPVSRSLGYTVTVVVVSIVLSGMIGVVMTTTLLSAMIGMTGHTINPSDPPLRSSVDPEADKQAIAGVAGIAAKFMGATTEDAREASRIATNLLNTIEAKSQEGARSDAGMEYLEGVVRSMATMAGKAGGDPVSEKDVDRMTQSLNALAENYKGENVIPAAQLESFLPRHLENFAPAASSHAEASLYPGSDQGGVRRQIARAAFQQGPERLLTLTLTDTTAHSFLMNREWVHLHAGEHQESDTGLKRSFRHQGHPALIQYDETSHAGSIEVWIDHRFLLEAEGHHVTDQELRMAIDGVDLSRLAALKNPLQAVSTR